MKRPDSGSFDTAWIAFFILIQISVTFNKIVWLFTLKKRHVTQTERAKDEPVSVEVMAEKAANYIGEEYRDDDFESVCYGLKMLCYVSEEHE